MTENYTQLCKDIATNVQAATLEKLTDWAEVYLDVRFDGHGNFHTKIRAKSVTQENVSVSDDMDLSLMLIDLDLERTTIGEEWFGFLMTITKDGQCNCKLNYDSDTYNDASFFAK